MIDTASHEPGWPPGRVALATLVVVAIVAVLLLLYYFSHVFFLLLIAIVVAVALNPVVKLTQRTGISRSTASVVIYLVLGGLLVVGAWFAFPPLHMETAALLDRLPHSYQQFRDYLIHVPSELVSRFAERLPTQLPDRDTAVPADEAISTVAQIFAYATLLGQGIYLVSAMVLLAFYWSVYEDRTVRGILILVPAAHRQEARDLVAHIDAKLGAYVRAQGLLCLIMGGLVFLAYWLIGLPYPLALGVVAGVLEALPVFGPVLAAIPALLVALSVGPSTALWTLAAVVVLQQFESNVLVPRLMDRSVGVNAIVTLLSIAALSALWGLPGAILAIPLAAVAQLALDRWVFRPTDANDRPAMTGRGAASLLRYQLRGLMQDVQIEFRRKSARVTEGSDRLEEEVERLAYDLDRALLTATSQPVSAGASKVAP